MDECNVKVFARLRPVAGFHSDSLVVRPCETNPNVVQVEERSFVYDGVFDHGATQEQVFERCGRPMVQDLVKGFNATVFAYGQTSAGKTYTIFGGKDDVEVEKGLLPRMLEELFRSIRRTPLEQGEEFLCKGGLVEIYNEKINDLLVVGAEGLQLRESIQRGVYVENQSEVVFESEKEALEVVRHGMEGRRIGETAMNKESSRSHTVFTLILESKRFDKEQEVFVSRTSKLNIVDLAGSERQKLTKATGERQREANYINKSLLCLGTVISSLAALAESNDSFTHIKYRDSKLTFLLRDSLGGNSKTNMIANVNPLPHYLAETLSTLKFAQRAKRIRNKAKINEDIGTSNIVILKQTIKNLREKLAVVTQQKLSPSIGPTWPTISTEEQEEEEKEEAKAHVDDMELQRVEQLLNHSLSTLEACRSRVDGLTKIVTSKNDECEKWKRTLHGQKALFKMKSGQVSHVMKNSATLDKETVEKWLTQEKQLYDEIQSHDVQVTEWRTKYEQILCKYENCMEQENRNNEIENMNRKLCEETKRLLERNRELQDLVASKQQQQQQEEEEKNSQLQQQQEEEEQQVTPTNGYTTPAKQQRKPPLMRSSSKKGQTPIRVPFLSSASKSRSSMCPTPTKEDFNKVEQEYLLRKKNNQESNFKLEQDLEAKTAKVEELNAQIYRLQSELEDMKKDIQYSRRAEEDANNKMLDLQSALQAAKGEALEKQRLQEDLDNLTAQNELFENRIAGLEQEKQDLESMLAEARHVMEETDDIHQLQDEMESLNRMREAQQQTDALRIAKLKSELGEAQRNEQTAITKLNELATLLNDYRAAVQNERTKREQIQAENEMNEAEKREMQIAIENEQLEKESLRENLNEAKAELARVHEAQKASERQLALQLELLKPTDESLEESLEKERSARIEAQNQVADLQLQLEELASANAKLAGNQNLRQKIKYVQALKDQIAEMRENDAKLRKELGILKMKVGQQHQENCPETSNVLLSEDEA